MSIEKKALPPKVFPFTLHYLIKIICLFICLLIRITVMIKTVFDVKIASRLGFGINLVYKPIGDLS
jgi:hypothetical protein